MAKASEAMRLKAYGFIQVSCHDYSLIPFLTSFNKAYEIIGMMASELVRVVPALRNVTGI